MQRLVPVFVLALSALAASCSDYRQCAPVDDEALSAVPSRLSETGLFRDAATRALADGVLPYAPQFELWSDGADKQRWIALPPGAVIDTSDPDAWQFPEGTRLWKEFAREGAPLETRLLQKTGPAPEDWIAVAYLWNDDGSDATLVAEGAADVHGTTHDVPSASDCKGCHDGTESRVLGFSMVQLSYEAADGQVDLDDLVAGGLLSAPPARRVVLPGDDVERAALGYLHANCAHCHNQDRPEAQGPRCYDPNNELDLRLLVDRLGSVEETPTYRTVVATPLVRPGDPARSHLLMMLSARGGMRMPPLGTEVVDDEGVSLLSAWIAGM